MLGTTAPVIEGNVFEENVASGADGGGLYFYNVSDGSIVRGNRFAKNFAGDHGGAIYAASGRGSTISLEIVDNVIWKNAATGREGSGDSGGGICLVETSAYVARNTFCSNDGRGSGQCGGGIVLTYPGSPVIEFNIIANSTQGGGILCSHGVTPTIRYNIAWANTNGDGVGNCRDWAASNGNLQVDPLFCDEAAGDLSVAANSPALQNAVGVIGAIPVPGCPERVPIVPTTWGGIKALYIENQSPDK